MLSTFRDSHAVVPGDFGLKTVKKNTHTCARTHTRAGNFLFCFVLLKREALPLGERNKVTPRPGFLLAGNWGNCLPIAANCCQLLPRARTAVLQLLAMVTYCLFISVLVGTLQRLDSGQQRGTGQYLQRSPVPRSDRVQ